MTWTPSDIVFQRVRLDVIDCIDAVCETDIADEPLDVCLTHLNEDLFDIKIDAPFTSGLDYILVSEQERERAHEAAPRLDRMYMAWDYSKPSTHPRCQPDWNEALQATAALLAAMRANAWAHADALKERQTGACRNDE